MFSPRYASTGSPLHLQPMPGQREIRRRPGRQFILHRPGMQLPAHNEEVGRLV